MKIEKICINLEGVLADFDGRIKELWGITPPGKHSTGNDEYRFWDQYWEQISNEPHFYESLALMPGALEMVKNIYEKYKRICEIVSEDHFLYDRDKGTVFCPEYEKKLYVDKTAWVQKFLPMSIECNWCYSGPLYRANAGYILIDYREYRIERWRKGGGTGILYRSPQETLAELRDIEESFCRQNEKAFANKLEQTIQDCKEKADIITAHYIRGATTAEGAKKEKLRVAYKAWDEIDKFCDDEDYKLEGDKSDDAYKAIYISSGIPIAKVPIRYYPSVEWKVGSIYYFYGVKNDDILFNDKDPVGKTYKFKLAAKMGEEKIYVDYLFEIKSENFEYEASNWKGWRCFDGVGKPEGYRWSEGTINVREFEGEIQSVAIQKTYPNPFEPIWKKRSPNPATGYSWLGINEDLPENLEIPEGEFYYDATTDPPRGRHYKEYGILAYDDTDEIVILGIKDPEAEIVEIPPEINGKPVTVLDESCFANGRYCLRKVILPDTIKEIGDYAFAYCEKLEKPIIPASVTKIGENIFANCSFEKESRS